MAEDPRPVTDPMMLPSSGILWPLGQQVFQAPTAIAGVEDSWCDFKLRSARWYLEALAQLERDTRDLTRFAGVEMALEGCLSNLFSAFDASAYRLIESLVPKLAPDLIPPTYQWGWPVLRTWHERGHVNLDCYAAVQDALAEHKLGQERIPLGWLAALRRVRNRAIHESSLGRHFSRTDSEDLSGGTSGGFSQPTQVIIAGPGDDLGMQRLFALEPGAGFISTAELVPWLTACLKRAEALCALILADRAPKETPEEP